MLKYLRVLVLLIVLPAKSENINLTPVIAHKTANVVTLNTFEVKDIFTFKKAYWSLTTERITVVMMPLSNIGSRIFMDTYLGMPYAMYVRIVKNRLNSGRGNKPLIVTDNMKMIEKIARTKHSIGYLDGLFYYNYEGIVSVIPLDITSSNSGF